jgi:hypothetical protein
MSDDLNPETRRLVELARQARTPGGDAKLRIAERLAVPLAVGAAAGSAATAAKAAVGAATAAKAGGVGLSLKLAALVAVGAIGAAALVVTRQSPEPAPQAPSVQPADTPKAVLLEPSREPTPPTAVPEALPLEPPAPSRAPAAPGVHSSKPGDELAAEAALLHQAQAAWRAGQSAQALALANQHAQRFPRSQLANERDVLRVLSLCRLGQKQNAKQVGARLLEKAKGSPWYQSVAESCAAE